MMKTHACPLLSLRLRLRLCTLRQRREVRGGRGFRWTQKTRDPKAKTKRYFYIVGSIALENGRREKDTQGKNIIDRRFAATPLAFNLNPRCDLLAGKGAGKAFLLGEE